MLFVGIRYFICELFSDLNNMLDPQTCDMRQIRQMTLALPLSSARLSKL